MENELVLSEPKVTVSFELICVCGGVGTVTTKMTKGEFYSGIGTKFKCSNCDGDEVERLLSGNSPYEIYTYTANAFLENIVKIFS